MNLQIIAVAALALASCDRIPGTDAYKIKVSEKVVADGMYDPAAAQFRNAMMRTVPEVGGKISDAYCGEVNGKNQMGAYVGFRRVVVIGDPPTTWIDPQWETTERQVRNYVTMCEGVESLRDWLVEYVPDYSTCHKARTLAAEFAEQAAFNAVWRKACGKPP